MLLRLLLLCCALVRWADACLPMQPGELPCPSQPPTFKPMPEADGSTVTSKLDGPTYSMGNTVYSCPFTMISSDKDEKPGKWEIVCKPDSGFFIIIDENKKEKQIKDGVQYGCSEKACLPAITQFESATTTYPSPYMVGGPIEEKKTGDTIIVSCPKGSALYLVDPLPTPAATPITEANAPTCTRDSGNPWSKPPEMKLKCLKKTCTPPVVATTDLEHCPVQKTTCSFADVDMNADKTEVKCKTAPFEVNYREGTGIADMKAKTLTCDTTIGLWKTDTGATVEKPSVTCARDSMCTSCTVPMLLDPKTSEACKNPTSDYCSAMVVTTPDDPSMCSKLACGPGDGFFTIITSDNMIVPLKNEALCKDGKWKVGNEPNEPNFGKGVVCSKALDCTDCKMALENAYDKASHTFDDVSLPPNNKPTDGTCTFTCNMAGFSPKASDMTFYDSVTCDATTKMAMFMGGPVLSNGWFCDSCGCTVGGGGCPPLYDCVDVIPVGCVYKCPPDAISMTYRDASGKLHMAAPTEYRCIGQTFPELTGYAKELKCIKTKASGTETIPPETGCTATIEDPPAPLLVFGKPATGTFSNLRYMKTDTGAIAFCLTGVLWSPDFQVPVEATMLVCNGATWDHPVATCLDDNKFGIGGDCETVFPDTVFNYKCNLGLCGAVCKNGQMKIKVNGEPAEENASGGLCWQGELPVTVDDTDISITEARCQ